MIHSIIQSVTEDIISRSAKKRESYLFFINSVSQKKIARSQMDCANLAHACAALPDIQKQNYIGTQYNIGIVTAYNDMLSAHQPFEKFPDIIRKIALDNGMTVQVAGGVPAMCDGITQGYGGMELSLLSRDHIAQGVGIALSHNCFDGSIYLGVCDKIIPGLLIGALRFGYLPSIFIPAGPMPSGISNTEKTELRNQYVTGNINKETLLQSELKSYHTAGTCTFYGTANSNQLLMEIAGLHLPHTTFIPPNTSERTTAICDSVIALQKMMHDKKTLSQIVTEKTIVNMMIALLATGGSTNLTIHLITIAKAAGIVITWKDFHTLSHIIPTLTKLYPNGTADINAFHHAGGVGFLIATLLKHGLLHPDVQTVIGNNLHDYALFHISSKDESILRPASYPFSPTGGLIHVTGTIGEGIVKISAVAPENHYVTAPAHIFYTQEEFKQAFEKNTLNKDMVAIFPYQGPQANGMPELHKLTPALTVLQNRGFKVALVTDGRMSGASGKIPAAIHISPEAACGGMIGKITNGDMVTLDCKNAILTVISDFKNNFVPAKEETGYGRELFHTTRRLLSNASEGATIFDF